MGRKRMDPGVCLTCGRTMRPRGAKKADYPGTMVIQCRGTCVMCYRLARRALKEPVRRGHPWVDPGVCETCGFPMRSTRTKAADAPGTRPRFRAGLCGTCYKRSIYVPHPRTPEPSKPQPVKPVAPPKPPERARNQLPVMDGGADQNTLDGLLHFLDRRRARFGTRPEGVRFPGEN